MMIGAGALGIAWIALKATATANDPAIARDVDRNGRLCIESCYIGTLFNSVSAPLLVGSMGLLGGGMHRLGVHHGFRDDDAGGSRRRSGIMLASGIALLGGGVVTFVGSQVIGHSAAMPNEASAVTVREVGWWSAGLMGLSGAALTGYAHGRLRADRARRVAVAPSIGPRFAGVSMGGTF